MPLSSTTIRKPRIGLLGAALVFSFAGSLSSIALMALHALRIVGG